MRDSRSLLRPSAVRDARAQSERGELSATDLKRIQDSAILDVIAKQEALGLKGITGGETKPKALRVTGKIGFTSHPMIDHFRFLQEHVSQTAKVTIPSPSVLHFRGGRKAVPDPTPQPGLA